MENERDEATAVFNPFSIVWAYGDYTDEQSLVRFSTGSVSNTTTT